MVGNRWLFIKTLRFKLSRTTKSGMAFSIKQTLQDFHLSHLLVDCELFLLVGKLNDQFLK